MLFKVGGPRDFPLSEPRTRGQSGYNTDNLFRVAAVRCDATRGAQVVTPRFASIFPDFQLAHELPLLAQRALLETRADGVAIALKEGGGYVCKATAGGMAPGIGVRLHNDTGITAACIRSAQAVVCSDAASDERVNATACQALGIAAIAVVPVQDGRTVVGVIEALSQRAGAFGAAEQAVLESIAHKIEELTPGQPEFVHDDPAKAPDLTAVLNLFDGEEEMPGHPSASPRPSLRSASGQAPPALGTSVAREPGSDVVPDAEQGNETSRKRSMALMRAQLVICLLIVAGLLMMFGPAGAHKASAAEQLSARIGALPLDHLSASRPVLGTPVRRPELLAPSSATPTPARRDSGSSGRRTSQPAARKNGGSIRDLEASARAGDASAQVRLADALASGAGVAADPLSAEAWYIVAHLAGENAATGGMRSLSRRLSNSQTAAVRERLATMYWEGIGVRADRIAAYCWLTLSEAAGARGVGARKQRLARDMTRSQIEEANLRAQQWLKQHNQLIAQGLNN